MPLNAMKKNHTHYDTLGVARNTPPEVIKAAHKALARSYHPDRNPDDPEATCKMAALNAAYAVLSDPQKRTLYDEELLLGEADREFDTRSSTAHASKGSEPGGARPSGAPTFLESFFIVAALAVTLVMFLSVLVPIPVLAGKFSDLFHRDTATTQSVESSHETIAPAMDLSEQQPERRVAEKRKRAGNTSEARGDDLGQAAQSEIATAVHKMMSQQSYWLSIGRCLLVLGAVGAIAWGVARVIAARWKPQGARSPLAAITMAIGLNAALYFVTGLGILAVVALRIPA
jgi:DnaJ-class molecular chaperone